jgi:hypothetical protein
VSCYFTVWLPSFGGLCISEKEIERKYIWGGLRVEEERENVVGVYCQIVSINKTDKKKKKKTFQIALRANWQKQIICFYVLLYELSPESNSQI